MDGSQAALGGGDDVGCKAVLRGAAPLLGGRVCAHDDRVRLHHHPQRSALALRGDVLQLAAPRRLEDGLVRENGHRHVAALARHVPDVAREWALRDGLSQHAVARDAAGRGSHGHAEEDGGGRQEGKDEMAGAARHSWRYYCTV